VTNPDQFPLQPAQYVRVRPQDSASMHLLTVTEPWHAMSWSRAQLGYAELRISTHESGAYLDLCLSECPQDGAKHQAMMTVREEGARALYARLHALYGPKPQESVQ